MKGTEHEPKIEQVKVRFIKDADSTLSALRGEIHLYYGVPETKYDVVKGDSKLKRKRSKATPYPTCCSTRRTVMWQKR